MTARLPKSNRGPERRLRRWATSIVTAAVVALATTASPVHAAEEDEELPDARLTGYEGKMDIGGGVALSYAMLAVLGAIAIGVTFKNARRSHLD